MWRCKNIGLYYLGEAMGFRERGLEWDREGLSPTPNTSYSCYSPVTSLEMNPQSSSMCLVGLGLGFFLVYFMVSPPY